MRRGWRGALSCGRCAGGCTEGRRRRAPAARDARWSGARPYYMYVILIEIEIERRRMTPAFARERLASRGVSSEHLHALQADGPDGVMPLLHEMAYARAVGDSRAARARRPPAASYGADFAWPSPAAGAPANKSDKAVGDRRRNQEPRDSERGGHPHPHEPCLRRQRRHPRCQRHARHSHRRSRIGDRHPNSRRWRHWQC